MDLGLKHLSMSSVRLFLEDRNMFYKKYVLKNYEQEATVPMFIGKVCHEYLAWYYIDKMQGKEPKWEECDAKLDDYIDENIIELSEEDQKGKEKIRKDINKVLDFYKQDGCFETYNPIGVELSVIEDIYNINGEQIKLPIKGILDLVIRGFDNSILVVDHKFVSSFSKPDTRVDYMLQAYFYFFLVSKAFDQYPTIAIFDEIKKTGNRDKTPQVQSYFVQYNQEDMDLFLIFFDAVCKVLTGENMELMMFLPNPYHHFNGVESWNGFVENKDLLLKKMYNK